MKFTSRERYDILKKCVQAYFDKANNTKDMLWVFSVDTDDNTFKNEDFIVFLHDLKLNYRVYTGNSLGKIDAINRDINDLNETWDILLNISDDQFPIKQGYDDVIRDNTPDDLDCSLWFMDGHQNRINTQEILGRKYYERFGYIYFPEYKSFFCDDEATAVAIQLHKIVKIDECLITHLHPDCADTLHPEYDDLYKKNEKYWKQDSDLFNKRKTENYELFSKW